MRTPLVTVSVMTDRLCKTEGCGKPFHAKDMCEECFEDWFNREGALVQYSKRKRAENEEVYSMRTGNPIPNATGRVDGVVRTRPTEYD